MTPFNERYIDLLLHIRLSSSANIDELRAYAAEREVSIGTLCDQIVQNPDHKAWIEQVIEYSEPSNDVVKHFIDRLNK